MGSYDREILLAGIGIVLIFTFAFGSSIFSGMIHHIIGDLTSELGIHLYIVGWALVLYGLYRVLRKQKENSSKKQ